MATKRICIDPGCDLPYSSRDYCKKHYQIRYKAGEFKDIHRQYNGVTEGDRLRLYAPEGAPDECWEWTGSTHNGYGHLSVKGKPKRAHVLAWEEANGHSVPEGLVVRHRCDNPPCVNPSHLEIGTRSDNAIDAVIRGRQPLRLTTQKVKQVKRKLSNGESIKSIAEEYGVSIGTIDDIKRGKTWWYVMQSFKHKPLMIHAIQAKAPWQKVQAEFPRSHLVKSPNGRASYLHIVDGTNRTKALPGEWIIRHEDGAIQILTDEEFHQSYGEVENG